MELTKIRCVGCRMVINLERAYKLNYANNEYAFCIAECAEDNRKQLE